MSKRKEVIVLTRLIIVLLKEDTYLIFNIDVGSHYQQSGKAIIIILADVLSKEQFLA